LQAKAVSPPSISTAIKPTAARTRYCLETAEGHRQNGSRGIFEGVWRGAAATACYWWSAEDETAVACGFDRATRPRKRL